MKQGVKQDIAADADTTLIPNQKCSNSNGKAKPIAIGFHSPIRNQSKASGQGGDVRAVGRCRKGSSMVH
jgi:hypothetical protein